MASNNEKFPVTNKQAARIVQGIHTEVLVSGFKDKIFVVVTQYGRIGSLVRKIRYGTYLHKRYAWYWSIVFFVHR